MSDSDFGLSVADGVLMGTAALGAISEITEETASIRRPPLRRTEQENIMADNEQTPSPFVGQQDAVPAGPAEVPAKDRLDETVDGGRYMVGGQLVDAEGNPVKGKK